MFSRTFWAIGTCALIGLLTLPRGLMSRRRQHTTVPRDEPEPALFV